MYDNESYKEDSEMTFRKNLFAPSPHQNSLSTPSLVPLMLESDCNPLQDCFWSCGLLPLVSVSLLFSTTLAPNKHFFSDAKLYLLTDFQKTFIYRKHFRISYRLFLEIWDYWQGTMSARVFWHLPAFVHPSLLCTEGLGWSNPARFR